MTTPEPAASGKHHHRLRMFGENSRDHQNRGDAPQQDRDRHGYSSRLGRPGRRTRTPGIASSKVRAGRIRWAHLSSIIHRSTGPERYRPPGDARSRSGRRASSPAPVRPGVGKQRDRNSRQSAAREARPDRERAGRQSRARRPPAGSRPISSPSVGRSRPASTQILSTPAAARRDTS